MFPRVSRYIFSPTMLFPLWSLDCSLYSMTPTAPDKHTGAESNGLYCYVGLIKTLVIGPILLSLYVVAAWSLTATMSLTSAFPWSSGPLSNWLIWLSSALTLNLLARRLPGRS
jgi:hypothetical protein